MKTHQEIVNDGITLDRDFLVSSINHDHDYSFLKYDVSDSCPVVDEEEEVEVSEAIQVDVVSEPATMENDATENEIPETNPAPSTSSGISTSVTSQVGDKDAIIADLKKKLRNKDRIIKRLENKVKSLRQYIAKLKEKNFIDKKCEDLLNKKFSGPTLDIFTRLMKGKKVRKYSENVKSFALTLHFYSTKAYNFIRNTFKLSLPHPKSITAWYSKIPADPGFTEPAFKALELKVYLNIQSSSVPIRLGTKTPVRNLQSPLNPQSRTLRT